MNTVYFFYSEEEYQSIVRLITSFSSLNSHESHLIYYHALTDQYAVYSKGTSFPEKLSELLAIPGTLYTHDDLIAHVWHLRQESIIEGLRLCCYANCGCLNQGDISYFAARLITEIHPHSLLLLAPENTLDDVEKYLSRRLTKKKRQLPLVEMSAACINISSLYQNPIPDQSALNERLAFPLPLTSPFADKNKVLTVYLSDSSLLSEHLVNTPEHAYLEAIYDEDKDEYRISETKIDEIDVLKENVSLNIKDFAQYIKGVQAIYDLSMKGLNLCCSTHLGEQNSSIITETLSTAILRLNPTSLTLVTRNALENEDAQQYLSRKPSKLGYQLPGFVMNGACIEYSKLNTPEFIQATLNAPIISRKPNYHLSRTITKSNVLSVYITHHHPSVFSMDKLANACSLLHREPYITVYYDITQDRYIIMEMSTFLRKRQFYLSHQPSIVAHLFEVIETIRDELGINKLKLFTHASLGDPNGAFVTMESNKWIEKLRPELIGVFCTEQNQRDAFVYYHRGVTAEGYKLPQYDIKGYCINEHELSEYLSKVDVEPVVLESLIHNSPLLPGFYSHPEQLSIYLFNHDIDATLNIEPLVSFCENESKQPNIVVYYHSHNDTFRIKQIHSYSVPLAIPSEGFVSKEKLIQLVNTVKRFTGGALRLYSHSNLGNSQSSHITPLLNELVHAINPISLYLFCTVNTLLDVRRYLNRLPTHKGLYLPAIDMRGACFSEHRIQHHLTENSVSQTASEYLQTLLQDPPMLKSPARQSERKTGLFASCLPWLSCISSYHAMPSASNKMMSKYKPSSSESPHQHGLFSRACHRVTPTDKIFSINATVSTRQYFEKAPVKESLGLMKILTPIVPPHTVRDILRAFQYQQGILLYKDKLLHINPNLLLDYDPNSLLDDAIESECLHHDLYPMTLLIRSTRHNQDAIATLMKVFESLDERQYMKGNTLELHRIFHRITDYSMNKMSLELDEQSTAKLN